MEAAHGTIVTAIFDGYERPKDPPPGVARAVMVTDTTHDDRWEIIRRPDHGMSNSRIFFNYKLTPHVSISDDDDVIWVDGSMEPTGKDIGSLFDLVPPGGVGIYPHPKRDCFFEEADYSAGAYGGKERGVLAQEQAAYYDARGCPRHGGLWASGIIVWRGAQRTLGERWFAETMNWSASDQIALPYVAWRLGIPITTLPGGVYNSEWFSYVPHGKPGRTTR